MGKKNNNEKKPKENWHLLELYSGFIYIIEYVHTKTSVISH